MTKKEEKDAIEEAPLDIPSDSEDEEAKDAALITARRAKLAALQQPQVQQKSPSPIKKTPVETPPASVTQQNGMQSDYMNADDGGEEEEEDMFAPLDDESKAAVQARIQSHENQDTANAMSHINALKIVERPGGKDNFDDPEGYYRNTTISKHKRHVC